MAKTPQFYVQNFDSDPCTVNHAPHVQVTVYVPAKEGGAAPMQLMLPLALAFGLRDALDVSCTAAANMVQPQASTTATQ